MKRFLLVVVIALAMVMLASVAAMAFTDDFSYDNGNLYGKGEWNKGGATSWITVENGAVRINGGDTGTGRTTGTLAASGMLGLISIQMDVMGDGVGGSTSWGLNVDDISQADPAGGTICRWYGTTNSARGRNDWVGVSTEQILTGTPTWDHLSLLIDTANTTAAFSCNGTLLGTVNYGSKTAANVAIGRISFTQISNATGSGSIYFDNFSVTAVPEPSSLVALGMFGLSALGMIKRRK